MCRVCTSAESPEEPLGVGTPPALPHSAVFAHEHLAGVDEVDGSSPFTRDEVAALGADARLARQRSFLVGRAAAHRALATLDRDTSPILIGSSREPVWPTGVVGSISHTDEHGVALVALETDSMGIGIDVEPRDRTLSEIAGLYDQATNKEERVWLDALDTSRRDEHLLALFSAKESVFKALFPTVRSMFGFDAVSLQPTKRGFRARLVDDLHPLFLSGRTVEIQCCRYRRHVLTWVVLPQSPRLASVTPETIG